MATVTPDVFDSPAVGILCGLEHDGFTVQLEPDNGIVIVPRSRLTPERMAAITRYKDALTLLLRCCDAGVRARRAAFECQMALLGPGIVASLVFTSGIPYAAGVCFSCRDGLGRPLGFGRCWRCALAWRLACRLPLTPELATAIEQARRVS